MNTLCNKRANKKLKKSYRCEHIFVNRYVIIFPTLIANKKCKKPSNISLPLHSVTCVVVCTCLLLLVSYEILYRHSLPTYSFTILCQVFAIIIKINIKIIRLCHLYILVNFKIAQPVFLLTKLSARYVPT